MDNVAFLVVEFNNENDLTRFCNYIDAETRPDFEDEVPSSEIALFNKAELLSLPDGKETNDTQFVAYEFEMMDAPNREISDIFDIAFAFNVVNFTSFWRCDHCGYNLSKQHESKLITLYSDEKPPQDENLNEFLLHESCVKIIFEFLED